MALPMIAAGIAARAVAKKLATRAAGGIVGAGAKQVNPVYSNISNQTKDIAKNSGKGRCKTWWRCCSNWCVYASSSGKTKY